MERLGGFMERYRHLKAPERTVRDALVRAVHEVCGIEVDGDVFKAQDEATVYITGAHSVIKAEIYARKLEILNRANSILGREQLKRLL